MNILLPTVCRVHHPAFLTGSRQQRMPPFCEKRWVNRHTRPPTSSTQPASCRQCGPLGHICLSLPSSAGRLYANFLNPSPRVLGEVTKPSPGLHLLPLAPFLTLLQPPRLPCSSLNTPPAPAFGPFHRRSQRPHLHSSPTQMSPLWGLSSDSPVPPSLLLFIQGGWVSTQNTGFILLYFLLLYYFSYEQQLTCFCAALYIYLFPLHL